MFDFVTVVHCFLLRRPQRITNVTAINKDADNFEFYYSVPFVIIHIFLQIQLQPAEILFE